MRFRIIVAGSMLFGYINLCAGQERVNLSTGFGLPELFNIGFRYQVKQVQAGITVGSMPLKDEKLSSICVDIYLHFGNAPEWAERRVWYGRAGLNWICDQHGIYNDRYSYANLRFGRDINLSRTIGIGIDCGALIELSDNSYLGTYRWFNTPSIVPSAGINMFFRFK